MMKDFTLLSKEDFKDINKYSEFENKRKEIRKKSIIIRIGVLSLIFLLLLLIIMIFALIRKNNKLEQQANKDLINLSNNFRSDILNKESLLLLKKWIPNFNKPNYDLELLFKATRDGCHSETFINHVSEKNPTIILVVSQDKNVFGGYTERRWDKPKEDSNAFLFSITNKEKSPVNNAVKAIEWAPNLVFRFGTTDLIVIDDCLNKPAGTSISSGIYDLHKSLNPTNEIAFYIKDIEVFTLKELK